MFGVLASVVGQTGVASGLLLSACVATPGRANALLPYVLIPQFILGGGFLSVKEGMLPVLAWFLSPVYSGPTAPSTSPPTELPETFPGRVDYVDEIGLFRATGADRHDGLAAGPDLLGATARKRESAFTSLAGFRRGVPGSRGRLAPFSFVTYNFLVQAPQKRMRSFREGPAVHLDHPGPRERRRSAAGTDPFRAIRRAMLHLFRR